MKSLTNAAVLGLGLSLGATANADTIFGIYAGGGSISYDFSGSFQDLKNSGTDIDFEDDLGFKGDSGNYYYIALEHPIPILPNVKIAHSDIEETARNQLSQTITFDGTTFTTNQLIASKMDFTHTDFTFYYEILDNWVSLDLGLTARQFDGEISATDGVNSATQDLNFTMPMLYGKAQFDLPLTGLYAGLEGNWIGVGGANVTDVWAKLGYTFAFGLGLEAGLRNFALELDDVEDIDADATLKGTYIALTFHF